MRHSLLFLFLTLAGCSRPVAVPVPLSDQQTLDTTGTLTIPAGTTLTLPHPLFCGSGSVIRGENRYTSKIDCRAAGHGLIVGWRRGLVPDKHFVGGGFRTFAEAYPIDVGGELSLGPLAPGKNGWRGVKKLRVSITVTKHFVGPWPRTCLAGIQDADVLGDRARPSPWIVYVQGRFAVLAYRTLDGTITEVRQKIDPAADTLTLDFGEIEVEGLYQNTRWPFGLGRCPPTPGAGDGYWGSGEKGLLDLTFSRFELTVDGVTSKATWSRVPTYAGGPSLPLMTIGGPGTYTRSILVYHKDQGALDNVNNLTLSNLTITGQQGHALVNVGAAMGPVWIRDCELIGGSRAIQSLGNWVHYPLVVRDCNLYYQSDCNAHLVNASGVLFDGCQLNYGPRCAVETWNCNGEIRGPSMLAVPGPPCQIAPFIQHGGRMRYHDVIANYEYQPAPAAFLRLQPGSWLSPGFTTEARLECCTSGFQQYAVEVREPQPGYKAKSYLTISAGTAAERKVLRGGKTITAQDGVTLKW